MRASVAIACVVVVACFAVAGATAGDTAAAPAASTAPADYEGSSASFLTTAAANIKHVVVLMMENRSFLHMLGLRKDKVDPRVDGCTLKSTDPRCSNPIDPTNPDKSAHVYVTDDAAYIQPADPAHSIEETTEQVFGTLTPAPGATPLMDGFIASYAKRNNASAGGGADIMRCFPPDHTPIINALSDEFLLFDRWYAAVPGPTMVNRAYAMAATSDGMGHNDIVRIIEGLDVTTTFEQLDAVNKSWNVYFQDLPTIFQFSYPRKKMATNFKPFKQFLSDSAAGTLPTLSWLDPRYVDLPFLGWPASDQHPDHDVAAGEKFMKEVYESLRNSSAWNETLLVITYDEHGGFFDTVPPPQTNVPSPDGKNSTDPPFDFTRLGIRVPALLVSPWVGKNRLVHEPASGPGHYEHSSLPKTIRRMFAPSEGPLTARDAFAAAFDDLLDEPSPRTDCPVTLPDAPSLRRFGGLPPFTGQLPATELQVTLALMAARVNGNTDVTEEQLYGMKEQEIGLFAAAQMEGILGEGVFGAEVSEAARPFRTD